MSKMEFAKYYNVTDKVSQMINKKEIFSYQKDEYKGIYICEDTHDFWISRILEGYDENYDQEEGRWLVERNKIDKYDFIEFICEKENIEYNINNRQERDFFINHLPVNKIIKMLILMDDDKGLESWDNCEADSYNKCIEIIDGGFGIIELEEETIQCK